MNKYFLEQSLSGVWKRANDFWNLFLASQEDTRDPVDESWRSDVFVPLPFITTRTKAAQLTELLGNTEPVWQVEATKESGAWYDQSRYYERLLEHTTRANRWRKFLYRLMTARSVQGTALFKAVWTKRSHEITFFSNPAE